MIITKWYRQVKDKETGELIWDFNHISDGFDPAQTIPTAVSADQEKGWGKSKWKSIPGQLVNGTVYAAELT